MTPGAFTSPSFPESLSHQQRFEPSPLPLSGRPQGKSIPKRRSQGRPEHCPRNPGRFNAVHLKSRFGGASADAQRLAEAVALRGLISEEMGPPGQSHFVIAGDFNDQAHSPTLQALLGDGQLHCALEFLPDRKRATYPAKNPRHQLDFLLYPSHLQERLVATRIWQEARCSDHCLVVAEFGQASGSLPTEDVDHPPCGRERTGDVTEPHLNPSVRLNMQTGLHDFTCSYGHRTSFKLMDRSQ